ncbi:MAG: anti-sigma factor [Acidimicrobiales bacterium]|nr:anti-sigma factor [Acidimicrobiales bacterium]MBO0886740.1 anti-sigma factor [Acidimicrobiales bacterium]
MSHDDLQSLLGAYALDALDPQEVAVVEAHLSECPRCRSEVAAHRNTASLLATAGGEAPAGLWDRIAAELDHDEATPGEHLLTPPKVVPFKPRRRLALPVVGALASAAAAAAAVLGVSAARLDHRVNVLSSALNAGGLHQAAAAAVLSPTHRALQLVSVTNHQAVQVVILPDGNAYLVRSDLPALRSDRTYQLWGLVGGKIVSLGLLGSNPQVAAFRVDPGVSRLMVTAEPRGGVPQPTSPVLVQGNLPA